MIREASRRRRWTPAPLTCQRVLPEHHAPQPSSLDGPHSVIAAAHCRVPSALPLGWSPSRGICQLRIAARVERQRSRPGPRSDDHHLVTLFAHHNHNSRRTQTQQTPHAHNHNDHATMYTRTPSSSIPRLTRSQEICPSPPLFISPSRRRVRFVQQSRSVVSTAHQSYTRPRPFLILDIAEFKPVEIRR